MPYHPMQAATMTTSPDEDMLHSLVDSLGHGGGSGGSGPSPPPAGPSSADPGVFRLPGYSPFSPRPLPGPPPIPMSPFGLRLGGAAGGGAAGLVPPSPRWGAGLLVPPSPRAWGGGGGGSGGGAVPPSPRTQHELEFIGGLLQGGDLSELLLTPRAPQGAADSPQLPAGLASPGSWLRSPAAPTPTTPRTAGVLRWNAASPTAPGQAAQLGLQPLPEGAVLSPEMASYCIWPGAASGGVLQPVPPGVLVQPEPVPAASPRARPALSEPPPPPASTLAQSSPLIHVGALPTAVASAVPAPTAVAVPILIGLPVAAASGAGPAAPAAPVALAWGASAFAAPAAQADPARPAAHAAAAGGGFKASGRGGRDGQGKRSKRASPAPSASNDADSEGQQEAAAGLARMHSLPNLPSRRALLCRHSALPDLNAGWLAHVIGCLQTCRAVQLEGSEAC